MRPTLLALAVLGAGCAGGVRLPPGELERLRAGAAAVPVAFVASPRPWVVCPGNEGRQIWSIPGASRPSAPIPEARLDGRLPIVLASAEADGDQWLGIVNGYTENLRRSPPVDPSRATARSLAEQARAGAGLSLEPARDPVAGAGADALAGLGRGPVLVLETTQFALVGCFYGFEPWFDVRATLLEAAGGRVLWRASCGGAYPSDPLAPTPPELEADGMALYRRYLLDRASTCAAALLGELTRPAR